MPRPTPTACGIPPPTMPFVPSTPISGAKMCIEPPLPRQ